MTATIRAAIRRLTTGTGRLSRFQAYPLSAVDDPRWQAYRADRRHTVR